jgi:hypothetical protein
MILRSAKDMGLADGQRVRKCDGDVRQSFNFYLHDGPRGLTNATR